MPAATALADFRVPSTPAPAEQSAQQLGNQITELCGYIYAATYRLLVLIREFDEQGYWAGPGLCSCAHWLNFTCGIGMNAAREKVRVAHALAELPKISAAFEQGQVSYSKVRAMTRIADQDNEDYLLMVAQHGTAWHVEKLVSKYRRASREQDTELANATYADRQLNYHYDESGALVINARLPAEQGALVIKALEMAMENSFQRQNQDTDVSAETSADDRPPIATSITTKRADAIAEVAETYLNAEPSAASTADRYQVVVHVSAETLQDASDTSSDSQVSRIEDGPDVSAETFQDGLGATSDSPVSRTPVSRTPVSRTQVSRTQVSRTQVSNPHISCLDDGPHVSAETSRRIACDCSILKLTEDQDGEILSIGRKTRAIPPSIRRALRFRDDGCQFPGCTHSHFVDGHHIRHWADGGETSLDNLVQLCRHHHRLVHEGGFGCERKTNGQVEFRSPSGSVLPATPPRPGISNPRHLKHWLRRDNPKADIDALSCVTLWGGERMDWDIAVGRLFG